MSETKVHYQRSLENARKNFPELFSQEKKTVMELLLRLHEWLDYYADRQGADEEGQYDFTRHLAIRHRAKRHHLQGVNQAVEVFSEIYGEQFTGLIRQEAQHHIFDDMGQILFAEDYQRIGFWKNYQ
jgi:hypothetical protein